MSFNQSKSDKSDAVYRKSGRSASFNQQRGSSGGAYVKGGGGAAVPSPSLSSSRRSVRVCNFVHVSVFFLEFCLFSLIVDLWCCGFLICFF